MCSSPLLLWLHPLDTMDIMNRLELLQKCKDLGLKNINSFNKTQLIQLLETHIHKAPSTSPIQFENKITNTNTNTKIDMMPPYIIPNIICPPDIIEGKRITKEIRQQCFGHIAGGAGSRGPEDYQRSKIEEGTHHPCVKTNTRINLRTFQLENIAHPNTFPHGFDFSEDFDGMQQIPPYTIYINLKCIVGKGGAQTRSLREVYWFVEGQLHALKKMHCFSNTLFANILDGDEAHHSLTKFEYLLSLPDYQTVKQNIYVGDLSGYFRWISQRWIMPSQSDV